MTLATHTAKENFAIKLKSLVFALLITFAVFALLSSSQIERKAHEMLSLTEVFSAEKKPESKKNSDVKSADTLLASMPNPMPLKTLAGTNLGISKIASPSVFAAATALPRNILGSSFTSDLSDSNISADTLTFEFNQLDKTPKLISKTTIKYPAQLLKRGIEGEVLLSVIIDIDGSTRLLEVLNTTDKLFTDSALEALHSFRYEAPIKNGKAVKAKFILPIPFKISK